MKQWVEMSRDRTEKYCYKTSLLIFDAMYIIIYLFDKEKNKYLTFFDKLTDGLNKIIFIQVYHE